MVPGFFRGVVHGHLAVHDLVEVPYEVVVLFGRVGLLLSGHDVRQRLHVAEVFAVDHRRAQPVDHLPLVVDGSSREGSDRYFAQVLELADFWSFPAEDRVELASQVDGLDEVLPLEEVGGVFGVLGLVVDLVFGYLAESPFLNHARIVHLVPVWLAGVYCCR